MDLEKDVVRKDFPLSRRGYDTAAVDAYLARLSERLRETESRDEAPVARSVSEQVAGIVSAAEKTAAEMHRTADEDTSRMLAQAAADARAHVQRVEDASKTMLSEVAAIRERSQDLLAELESNSRQLADSVNNLREDVSTFRGQAADDARPTSSKGPSVASGTVAHSEDEEAAEQKLPLKPLQPSGNKNGV